MANEDLQLLNAVIGAISDRFPTAKDRSAEEIQRENIKMQMAQLTLAGNAQTALNDYRNLQLYGKENPTVDDVTLAQQKVNQATAEAAETKRQFNLTTYGVTDPGADAQTLVSSQFHRVTAEDAAKYTAFGTFEEGMQIPQAAWLKVMHDHKTAVPLGKENSMYLHGDLTHENDKMALEDYSTLNKNRLANTPVDPMVFKGHMEESAWRELFFEKQTPDQKKSGEWIKKDLNPRDAVSAIDLITKGSDVDKAMELVNRKNAVAAFSLPPLSVFNPSAYEKGGFWFGGYDEGEMMDMIEGKDGRNPYPLANYKAEGMLPAYKTLYNANDPRGLAAVENLQVIGDELMKNYFYAPSWSEDRQRAFKNLQEVQTNYKVITGKHFKPSPGVEVSPSVVAKFPSYKEGSEKKSYVDSPANPFASITTKSENKTSTIVKAIIDSKGQPVNPNDTSNVYLYQTEDQIRDTWSKLPEIAKDSTQSQSYWMMGGATEEQGYKNFRAWYENNFRNQVEMGHLNPDDYQKLEIGDPDKKKVAVPKVGALSTSAQAEIDARSRFHIIRLLRRAKQRSPQYGSIKEILTNESGWSSEAADYIIKNY